MRYLTVVSRVERRALARLVLSVARTAKAAIRTFKVSLEYKPSTCRRVVFVQTVTPRARARTFFLGGVCDTCGFCSPCVPL